MKTAVAIGIVLTLLAAVARGEDPLDRVDDALTWSLGPSVRAHVSGTADAEGYALPDPAPGVIDAVGSLLFNPRVTTFLDVQLGQSVYAFAQVRIDRGFDPSNDPLRARLDEYAVRWAIDGRGRINLQVGKFATVVGNWTERHGSWTDPFITAPLPYENLTGVWDTEPPHSAGQLLVWSHVRPGLPAAVTEDEKYRRLPILWGPDYATGAAVAGDIGQFNYAFEVKNASLSSRPETWSPETTHWEYPTVSGRIGWRPDESWGIGWSASSGSFLRPEADPLIPAAYRRGDYREEVLAQDVSFAWHHVQLWAEVFAARFTVPPVGDADSVAYYLEAKYKFTPQFFAAVRWNQQLFGTVPNRGIDVRWGQDTWRWDVAPTYRFTPHLQLKLQYSLQRGNTDNDRLTHFFATQATLRF
ncbi:MAG TPA: hypothetical protein VHE61_12625 [Opitutaceae bacterium]|nr:hypothetical protein [Opitutaceae bacterium]